MFTKMFVGVGGGYFKKYKVKFYGKSFHCFSCTFKRFKKSHLDFSFLLVNYLNMPFTSLFLRDVNMRVTHIFQGCKYESNYTIKY